MRLGEALATLGRPIAFYPVLGRACGGLAPGVLLCQLAYWHGKQRDPDGWIRKSSTELEVETGMTRREQQSARAVLRGLGVIEERVRGLPPTVEYRLSLIQIDALLPPINCTERGNQLHPTVQSNAPNGATISESTTETTPEKKQRSLALARARDGFAAFWDVYPRKVAKAAAVKAWQATAPVRPLLATVLSSIAAQAASEQWQESPRYIPHPATWLNRHSWDDETPEQQGREEAKASATRIKAMKDKFYAQHPEVTRA